MSDVRDPGRDQRLPEDGKLNVQDELVEYIRADYDAEYEPAHSMVKAVLERKAYGIKKYGKPLQTQNGRDALLDAWEEAVDLTSYLAQLALEPAVPGQLFVGELMTRALAMFHDLTEMRLARGDRL